MDLRIGPVIGARRKELGVTQEQLAQALGVSTPAVSKWERGITYPDITLLPPLARFLGLSVDELLAFEPELSPEAAGELEQALCRAFEERTPEEALRLCDEFLREYPGSLYLKLRLAHVLFQYLTVFQEDEKGADACLNRIVPLLQAASKSEDAGIREAALTALTSCYVMQEKLDDAMETAKQLPQALGNRRQMLSGIHLQKGELAEAKKLDQESLWSAFGELNLAILSLAGVLRREGREEDGVACLDTLLTVSHSLGVGQGDLMVHLMAAELYAKCGKKEAAIERLARIPACVEQKDRLEESPLFDALSFTESKMSEAYRRSTLPLLFRDNPAFRELAGDPAFERIVGEITALPEGKPE